MGLEGIMATTILPEVQRKTEAVGNTIDEMVWHFAAHRDKGFQSHVCTKQSITPSEKDGLPKKTE
jgi:hypothetical protein